jgi:type II secretory ATPase GspE/PulE/Tfp pilus assembly ATPase PilB-like protein
MVQAFQGAGCAECGGRGFTSRVGIFELMELNDHIRKLIMNNADASVLTDAARRNGMRNLREDGWKKISEGTTTVSEVMRVTQEF